MKVGITGQSGFIGTHLAAAVDKATDMELVPFEDAFFAEEEKLRSFVRQCDAVMHLAAMSRASSEDELYKTNMGLVEKLVSAMEAERVAPHVLFSSSTHETRDTAYGRAKKDGREMLSQWAEKSGGVFTGFIFPNVYGPGARVFYASFIANFAWQLNHGEEPKLLVDAPIKLIYVQRLVNLILSRVREAAGLPQGDVGRNVRIDVPWDFEAKVSDILSLFKGFKENGPGDISDDNRRCLYETFVSYR